MKLSKLNKKFSGSKKNKGGWPGEPVNADGITQPVFEKGGKIKNQYKGKTPEQVWEQLTGDQKEHWLKDHSSLALIRNLNLKATDYSDMPRMPWSKIPKPMQSVFTEHVLDGQYARGGLLKKVNSKIESIIKHYLPDYTPDEVVDKSDLNKPGAYLVDEDDGDIIVDVYLGDEYDNVLSGDYSSDAAFAEKVAGDMDADVEILSNDSQRIATFVFTSGKFAKGGRTKAAIAADKNIKALHPGKRISNSGNEYYENRPNRSDMNRTKKFEGGGNANNEDDLIEFTIPSWAVPSLINSDDSGLEQEDIEKLEKFVSKTVKKYGNAHFMLPPDDELELGFKHSNSIDNLGSDCMLLLLRPSKEFSKGGSVDSYKRKIRLPEIAYSGKAKSNAVEINVEIKNKPTARNWETLEEVTNVPEVSMSAGIWNSRESDWVSGGQMLDQLPKHYRGDNKLKRLVQIWEEYHLNDMKAGTKKQSEAIDKWEAEGNQYDYQKAVDYLKSIDLYEDRGYKYGHGWLYKPVPEDVLKEIKEIADSYPEFHAKYALGGKPLGSTGVFAEGGEVSDERVEDVLKHYMIAALWSSTDMDSDSDENLDANYGIEDIDPSVVENMRKDVRKFLSENKDDLAASELPDEQIGHTFWLQRAGHGSGWYDFSLDPDVEKRLSKATEDFKNTDLYVGDDGKVHAMGYYELGGKPAGSTGLFAKGGATASFSTVVDEIPADKDYPEKMVIAGITTDGEIYYITINNGIRHGNKKPYFSMTGNTVEPFTMSAAKKYALQYWVSFFEDQPEEIASMNERMGTKFRSAKAAAKYVIDVDGDLHGFDKVNKLGEIDYNGTDYIFQYVSGGQHNAFDELSVKYLSDELIERLNYLWKNYHLKDISEEDIKIPVIAQDVDEVLKDAIAKIKAKKYELGGKPSGSTGLFEKGGDTAVDMRMKTNLEDPDVSESSFARGGYTATDGEYSINVHGEDPTDSKIVCKKINDGGKIVEVCYYERNDGQKKGIEVYSGENYIVGSKDKSYSRAYQLDKYPLKYKTVVDELMKEHTRRKSLDRFAKGGHIKSELKDRIKAAFPALTDENFDSHASDLYVRYSPELMRWLKANYEYPTLVTSFRASDNSGMWIEIPFTVEYKRFEKGGSANLTTIANGRYLTLATQGGKLHIFLTEKGKEWVKENGKITDDTFDEVFEDIKVNSDIEYYSDLGMSGLGLTSAPGFTKGYYMSDEGDKWEEDEGSRLWYYSNYVITDPFEELSDEGEVDFDEAIEPKYEAGGKPAGSTGLFAKGGKIEKVANIESNAYAENRIPFKGNNLEGKVLDNGDYVVLSYGYYPIWYYNSKEGKWYGNSTKYSVTTSKQMTQSRPDWNATMLTRDELLVKMQEHEAKYDLGGAMLVIPTPMSTDNTAAAHAGNPVLSQAQSGV